MTREEIVKAIDLDCFGKVDRGECVAGECTECMGPVIERLLRGAEAEALERAAKTVEGAIGEELALRPIRLALASDIAAAVRALKPKE